MKRAQAIVVMLIVAAACFGGGYWLAKRGGSAESAAAGGRKILYWHDPMHPSYKSDKPGIAPDCGMRLEPVYADGGAAAGPEKKVAYYHDPQNPSYRSDKPGLNPETGNDLVPVYEEPVPGTITIGPEKQQLIGVRFGAVEPMAGETTIRAVGQIAWDETRVSRVNAKIDGWVDEVFVDVTGNPVRKGERLLTIYSPELLASQQEYLLALRSKDVMKGSTLESARHQSDSLIAAARRRLELWDLSEAQIDEITRTGKPIRNITLYSPAGGIVTERKVFPKQRITPETELYTISDLSQVWVLADVFEHDVPRVRLGMPAVVSLSNMPGWQRNARVTQILPQVDPATRTLKVRLDLPNPGQVLKPDMFVDVAFRVSEGARLSVPVEAVLDTGERRTVYVDKGNGMLEPRHVETGARLGGRVEILSGLNAGERVVTSGNFLIDSESRLRTPSTEGGHHD
jgi:RND family efflux transporter MFP subunit